MTYLTRRATLARRCGCPGRRLAPPCPAAAGADPGGRRDAAQIRDRGRCEAAGAAPLQVRPGRRDALPREHEEVHRAPPASRSPSAARAGRTSARRPPSPPMSAAGPTWSSPGRRTRHLFSNKLLPLTDLADYLGKKYGGWFPVAEIYGKSTDGQWIAMPVGGSGSTMVYRKSWVKEAGFDKVPADFPGFLELCQALKRTGHPAGFALGNAVGDGGWTDWVLWGFDSAAGRRERPGHHRQRADARGARLRQGSSTTPSSRARSPGSTRRTTRPSSPASAALTSNGISVYYAAKNSQDAGVKALAQDIEHADFPVGPVGKPTQGALVINSIVFAYTPYPNAASEYLRFMMEQEQYVPWQQASIGYWCHPLAAYDANPVWTDDPKVDALSRRHAQRAASRATRAGPARPRPRPRPTWWSCRCSPRSAPARPRPRTRPPRPSAGPSATSARPDPAAFAEVARPHGPPLLHHARKRPSNA